MSRCLSTIALVEYQALYRKYRPQRFSDIIGQDHVTRTLSREVEEGRVAHAYLFAGPRGTGKTSTARILAKALNCPDKGKDLEPCGVCSVCVGIAEAVSIDVIELDAASHNSVEDIRDLRLGVSTVASGGGKRVFILDEAHMLSKAAGNALLKTLEEPPDHVHFVLATTEPYKLADTVRSRAQRFDFHPVAVDTIAGYLTDIASKEGYVADEGALLSIARHAGGSVRDSLSLLEQVAALGAGSVDASGVNSALGLADREAFAKLGQAISDQDAQSGLQLVSQLAAAGVDLRRFVAEAIAFYRGVFLTHYSPNVEEITDEAVDVVEDWKRTAALLPPVEVLRTIDGLSDALLRLREGREERLMVEMAVVRLTRPDVSVDVPSLVSRLDRLDELVKRATKPAEQVARSAPLLSEQPPEVREQPVEAGEQPVEAREQPVEETASRAEVEAEPEEPEEPLLESLEVEQIEEIWPMLFSSVRDDLGPRNQAFFREARPGAVKGATIVLHIPPHLDFHLEQLQSSPTVRQTVARHASRLLGGRVEVLFEAGDEHESEEAESDEAPDKDALPEAPAEALDPARLVKDLLGAEVVEEAAADH